VTSDESVFLFSIFISIHYFVLVVNIDVVDSFLFVVAVVVVVAAAAAVCVVIAVGVITVGDSALLFVVVAVCVVVDVGVIGVGGCALLFVAVACGAVAADVDVIGDAAVHCY